MIGGVADTIKNYAITGNTIADTIILANIIPIFIVYITTIFELLKNNISYIIEYLIMIVYNKAKSKIAGEVMCDVHISKTSPIYIPLKNIISSTNIHEKEIRDNVTKNILNIVNSNHSYRHKYYGYDNKYFLHTNPKTGSLILDNYMCAEDEKIKIFSKHDLYFVFKYAQDINHPTKKETPDETSGQTHSTIERLELKIIKFTDKIYSKSEINEKFNDFMKSDLKLQSDVIYLFRLNSDDKIFCDMIDRFFNNVKYNEAGKFLIGDNIFESAEVQTYNENNDYNVTFDISQLNEATENIKNNLRLNPPKNTERINSAHNLYKKYTGQLNNLTGMIGYFFDNNLLYFVKSDNKEIIIISKGKLITQETIKEKIEFLVKESFKKTTNNNNKKKYPVGFSSYDSNKQKWNSVVVDPRGFDTIYLPQKTIDSVTEEIKSFIAQSKLYKLCSIPYKKGLLFYGPPGTGKTSFVKAIAYEYQMGIYSINLNDSNINDESISAVLNSMGSLSNKILLFEDVDTAFADKEQIKLESKLNIESNDSNKEKDSDKKSVAQPQIKFLTYSGLLNALDGVMTNHQGVITIMTTNYIEKLGPALIRPGRIDNKFLLKECNKEQIQKMCHSIITKFITIVDEEASNDTPIIIPHEFRNTDSLNKIINDFADKLVDQNNESNIAPCKLQVYILKYIKNIQDIFNNYEELLQS